jgi:hypothetical protein
MNALMELIEYALNVLSHKLGDSLLSLSIHSHTVNRGGYKMWMRSHYVIFIELPQVLISEFFTHSLPTPESDACIFTIVSPEIVDITSFFP